MSEPERLRDFSAARATEGSSADESQELDQALHGQADPEVGRPELVAAIANRSFVARTADDEGLLVSSWEKILEQAQSRRT